MSGYGDVNHPMTMQEACSWEQIKPGQTVHLLGTVKRGDFTWQRPGVSIIAEAGAAIDGSLIISADDTTWSDLEVYKTVWTRQTSISGSDPADIDGGELTITGARTSLDGFTIHDLQSVGWWSGAVDSEITNTHVYYVGWQGPDRGHGHATYSQNASGVKTMTDCILHDCFGDGPIIYGSGTSQLRNYVLSQVVSFNPGSLSGEATKSFLIGGEAGATLENIDAEGLLSYGGLGASVGYNSGGDNISLVDCHFADGLTTNDLTDFTDTNNVKGSIGNAVYVFLGDGRATVAIYNEAQANTVTVNVSTLLSPGAAYRLRNSQNPSVDVVTGTVSGGGTISVDMRAVSHSVAAPVGWAAPATTFPTFGAFILEAV